MLKSFRTSNFRSLVNVEFRPVGSNLLIGPNNSGKTSLCSALRFLSLTASGDLKSAAETAVGETWNIANSNLKDAILNFDLSATLLVDGQPLDFDYTLQIAVEKGAGGLGVFLQATKEQLFATGGQFSHTILLDCTDEQARLLHEEEFLRGVPTPHNPQTRSPSDATMLSRIWDLQSNRRVNLFRQYLRSWVYFNLNPHAMRLPDVVSDKPLISWDGSNLSKVLFSLHNERPRVEKKIIEAVRVIEPKLDLFSFASPDPKSVYLFLEDQDGNRYGPQSMSDGTLRYIVFAYLVYSMADAKAPFPRLVMIEEPENGLYVGQLKPLFEKIDPSGAFGQFLFTSHSPYFIDLWEKNLPGVHLFKPGKPSSVLVRADQKKLEMLLEEMPLGELHFREMLA